MGDLYAQLGLSRSSSAEEVKAAFRTIALACHPDRNQGASAQQQAAAAQRFKEAKEAYEVLSDERARAVYNLQGRAGVAAAQRSGNWDARGGFSGYADPYARTYQRPPRTYSGYSNFRYQQRTYQRHSWNPFSTFVAGLRQRSSPADAYFHAAVLVFVLASAGAFTPLTGALWGPLGGGGGGPEAGKEKKRAEYKPPSGRRTFHGSQGFPPGPLTRGAADDPFYSYMPQGHRVSLRREGPRRQARSPAPAQQAPQGKEPATPAAAAVTAAAGAAAGAATGVAAGTATAAAWPGAGAAGPEEGACGEGQGPGEAGAAAAAAAAAEAEGAGEPPEGDAPQGPAWDELPEAAVVEEYLASTRPGMLFDTGLEREGGAVGQADFARHGFPPGPPPEGATPGMRGAGVGVPPAEGAGPEPGQGPAPAGQGVVD